MLHYGGCRRSSTIYYLLFLCPHPFIALLCCDTTLFSVHELPRHLLGLVYCFTIGCQYLLSVDFYYFLLTDDPVPRQWVVIVWLLAFMISSMAYP